MTKVHIAIWHPRDDWIATELRTWPNLIGGSNFQMSGQDGRSQKGLCMRYFYYLLIAVASALSSTYAVLWLTKPSPLENTTIPPLIFREGQSELLVWGGWKTVEGYQTPGFNAVEIRCSPERGTCSEAFATILHHTTGEDLEAQVFTYKVTHWDKVSLEAVAERPIGRCLERRLVIYLQEKTAALNWFPSAGCEADKGRAVLMGDPL
ncbi:MAG: hypothetical protein ACOH2I_05535 [Pseudomonas sp.]